MSVDGKKTKYILKKLFIFILPYYKYLIRTYLFVQCDIVGEQDLTEYGLGLASLLEAEGGDMLNGRQGRGTRQLFWGSGTASNEGALRRRRRRGLDRDGFGGGTSCFLDDSSCKHQCRCP